MQRRRIHERRSRRRALLARAMPCAAIVAAVVACGKPPDGAAQRETAESWTATARLAAEEHRAHAIPDGFAAQLRDRTDAALGEMEPTLKRLPPTDRDRAAARAAADTLRAALRALDAEIARR